MSRHADRRGPSPVSFGALSPRQRTATGATAAVAALGLALAAVSWSHPVHTTASSTHEQTRSMTFSYSAAVPRSPAYDSTTASSPGPVFRRLTDIVNVRFAYHGNPGTLTVNAELSAASGWHSTIPLQAPTTFDANNYDGTVRLDLSALDRRAHAAAAVTGLPTDPLTVTVLPRVTAADATSFVPPLRLTLTPLALTLADDPKNLNVTKVTTVRRNELVSATLRLHGRHITVATGRVIASALLLFAALAALILAWLKRRTAPANESAAIRMRYAALLLPVHPISTPAGHTVIDVTNFATLAKLAECLGLPVLHWSRSHVETFIMQDEGITYRYRAGDSNSATLTTPSYDDAPTAPTGRAPSSAR